ncbi:MAG TPA: hypothetical protein P5277_04665 [Candidatus Paceibacterota bacterium]|nr:hypothetical protein [Candidatus Paceibacterota bacterium]
MQNTIEELINSSEAIILDTSGTNCIFNNKQNFNEKQKIQKYNFITFRKLSEIKKNIYLTKMVCDEFNPENFERCINFLGSIKKNKDKSDRKHIIDLYSKKKNVFKKQKEKTRSLLIILNQLIEF